MERNSNKRLRKAYGVLCVTKYTENVDYTLIIIVFQQKLHISVDETGKSVCFWRFAFR